MSSDARGRKARIERMNGLSSGAGSQLFRRCGDGAARDAVLTTLKNNGKSLEYVVSEYPLEWKE